MSIQARVRQRTQEIQRLEGHERSCLYLHELSGYRPGEIAAALGIPMQQVYDHLEAAYRRLATNGTETDT